jgi:hypothetical protein
MAVTDLDMWIRKGVREALEKNALGEPYSFMCGPTLSPVSAGTPIYLVVISRPSPILGQTLMAPGIITVPVDQDELAKLVGELVDQLRRRASAELGVGFRQSA